MLIECACCKKEIEHQHLHNCAHGIPDLEKTHYETTYDRVQRLESQLAEAKAEVERLKEQFNRTSDVAYSFCQSAVKSTVVDICGMLKSAVQTSTPLECAKYIRDYYKLEG